MKRFLTALGFLFVLFAAFVHAQEDEHIAKLENGLLRKDGTTWSVHEAMKRHGNGGISVAVINNYEIAWTKGFGLREADKDAPITPDTLFSAGSMSKSVFAVLCVVLEEKGLLDLDAPVQQYLKSWKLPENEYTRGATISLRKLLSHTAGTTVHGFPDFYSEDDIPTHLQVLNGTPPATTEPVVVYLRPGKLHSYSGGGYQIAQLAVEDHLGTSLEELAKEHIFGPLGMTHATYRQYGSDGFPTNIAAAHDSYGVPLKGRFPVHPEEAAAGLWCTPRDLALLIIDIQKALAGKESKVVSPAAAKKLTTAVLSQYGLGYRVRELSFAGQCFYHSGSNDGIGGFHFGTMEGGNGMVVLASGENRADIIGDIGRALAKMYGWKQESD